MAVYKIKIAHSTGEVTQPIGAFFDNIVAGEQDSTTLTTKLSGIATDISSLKNQITNFPVASANKNGLMSSSDFTKLSNIPSNANYYVLPNATTSQLGGVKIGDGVSVSGGVISVPIANAATAGRVKIGAGINITTDGTISNNGVREASTSSSDGCILFNINGVSKDIKVTGWDSLKAPTASSIKVGTFVEGMTAANSTSESGMLRNIEYTNEDPGVGVANANNGLLICVYE